MDSELIVNRLSPKDLASALSYKAQGNRRDEALSPEGAVEPEWYDIFESINRHGNGNLKVWKSIASRISRERGLAYRPASLDESHQEGWTLGPIPWIISPERWAVFEAGISQRNRLFEELLKDIYGLQRTLREGLFPAEILLSHRGFLRSLHDLAPGNGVIGLGISAFDVARDSAGQTFVVNDRFDSPFGLGLALENRTVVNKVLPRLFRRCGIRQIGQFFTDWFDYLGRCSPSGSSTPQVVILDPSKSGEDSEIGFLANYCGISRVHPSDLTVRDGRVWIKALNGLVPVDVIWKTMPGRNMDSLESEFAGSGGTSGLFEAIRGGGVAVASHPGSEVLQSPGFYPYLPKICRTLLGEDLLIPPVATWWCGKPDALNHVVNNLQSMVIKPAGHHHDFGTKYGSRLSSNELAELKAQITATPNKFVGQEELLISTIPTTRGDNLVPRGGVLRMFSFKDGDNSTQVMPGGLARVSNAEGVVVSTREGGESKDVWVRSPVEEKPFSISSALSRSQLITPDIVPSRTGENLFWTGRYAERVDVISRFAARIVDVQISSFSFDEAFGQKHEKLLIKALFSIFGQKSLSKRAKNTDERLRLILENQDCTVSVPYNLNRFFYATQTAREEWSPASILAISSCLSGWNSVPVGDTLDTLYDSKLKMLQLNLSAFLGLNLDSMTRDEGWALLDAGRRLERLFVINGLLRFLLKTKISDDMSTFFNESILYILDSVRTFQSKFHDTPATELTTLLLIGERDYPRSVANLLQRLSNVLNKLPPPGHHDHPRDQLDPWIERIHNFTSEMENGHFDRNAASNMLEEMHNFLLKFSDSLTVSYFSHAKENV